MNKNDEKLFRDALRKHLDESRYEGYDQGFLDAFWVVLKVSNDPVLIFFLMDDYLSLANDNKDLIEELEKKAGSKEVLKEILYKLRWAILETDRNSKQSIELVDEAIEHYCR